METIATIMMIVVLLDILAGMYLCKPGKSQLEDNANDASPGRLPGWWFCVRHPIRSLEIIRTAQTIVAHEKQMADEQQRQDDERLDRIRNPQRYVGRD